MVRSVLCHVSTSYICTPDNILLGQHYMGSINCIIDCYGCLLWLCPMALRKSIVFFCIAGLFLPVVVVVICYICYRWGD